MTTGDSARLRQAAREAVAGLETTRAIELYEAILERNPADFEGLDELAFLYLLMDREPDAIPLYERILVFDSNNIEALFWKAWALSFFPPSTESLMEAKQSLLRIIELDSENASGYLSVTFKLLSGAEWPGLSLAERLAFLRRALELEPDAPAYVFALGSLYEESGRFDEAAAHYRRGLETTRISCERYEDPKRGLLENVVQGRVMSEGQLQLWLDALERVQSRATRR